MVASAKLISRLDAPQLAAIHQHFIYFEHSALYADYVSDIYLDGAGGGEKLVGESPFHCLVDTLFIIISDAICSGLVGILSVLNFAGNDEVYKELWKRNSGISSLGWNSLITEDAITRLSKEKILSVYDQNND